MRVWSNLWMRFVCTFRYLISSTWVLNSNSCSCRRIKMQSGHDMKTFWWINQSIDRKPRYYSVALFRFNQAIYASFQSIFTRIMLSSLKTIFRALCVTIRNEMRFLFFVRVIQPSEASRLGTFSRSAFSRAFRLCRNSWPRIHREPAAALTQSFPFRLTGTFTVV